MRQSLSQPHCSAREHLCNPHPVPHEPLALAPLLPSCPHLLHTSSTPLSTDQLSPGLAAWQPQAPPSTLSMAWPPSPAPHSDSSLPPASLPPCVPCTPQNLTSTHFLSLCFPLPRPSHRSVPQPQSWPPWESEGRGSSVSHAGLRLQARCCKSQFNAELPSRIWNPWLGFLSQEGPCHF